MNAVDDQTIGRRRVAILRRAEGEGREVHVRPQPGQLAEGTDRQSGGDLVPPGGDDRVGFRDRGGRQPRRDRGPGVELQIGAGLRGDLQRHPGHRSIGLEKEGQHAVVQAVSVTLLQGERNRRPQPPAVVRLAPDSSRFEDPVPGGMFADDHAAPDREQIGAVLKEREIERRQRHPGGELGGGVAGFVTEEPNRQGRGGPVHRQTRREPACRRDGARRRREGGEIDRRGELRSGYQGVERQGRSRTGGLDGRFAGHGHRVCPAGYALAAHGPDPDQNPWRLFGVRERQRRPCQGHAVVGAIAHRDDLPPARAGIGRGLDQTGVGLPQPHRRQRSGDR